MLHKRAVAANMGFHFGIDTKIIATGGASVNKSILQVVSDVFNAPVFVQVKNEMMRPVLISIFLNLIYFFLYAE